MINDTKRKWAFDLNKMKLVWEIAKQLKSEN